MKDFLDDTNIIFIVNPKAGGEDNDSDDEDNDSNWTPVVDKPKPKPKPKPKKRTLDIVVKNPKPVKNLDDLIDILEESASTRSSKRLKKKNNSDLPNLIKSLKELRELVGMENVKNELVNQILLFMQKMNDPGMFLHTVLTGNAGCGKTTLCHILAKIYKNMGFLSTDKVVLADRSHLIGKWLGETYNKTKELLDSANGGILLIDEAYSLGSPEGRDSFSKECIDCINQYLSENAEDFVCIIAGYKDDLDKCFFSQNQGLERRFPWKFHINQYNPSELYDIFNLQITQDKWKLKAKKEEIIKLLVDNKDHFANNGGDTKNLLDKCKICHAQRVFGSRKAKKSLTIDDINNGFKIYSKLKTKKPQPPMGLYV